MKSNLYTGPIYFNCFPNYFINLLDPRINKALILNLQTQAYNML